MEAVIISTLTVCSKSNKRAMMALYRSPEYHRPRKPDLEIIKANILTKIHDEYINNYDNEACLMDREI